MGVFPALGGHRWDNIAMFDQPNCTPRNRQTWALRDISRDRLRYGRDIAADISVQPEDKYRAVETLLDRVVERSIRIAKREA